MSQSTLQWLTSYRHQTEIQISYRFYVTALLFFHILYKHSTEVYYFLEINDHTACQAGTPSDVGVAHT